ncbi:hypothetical protein [Nocardia brasiliensis]|uniref:hypothetical protein n=1 Tax=Nocardia brasiliensis TaxID=37326 RepID=UPI0024577334|nr:hypothetical protein [Nocardia brasiliensis]
MIGIRKTQRKERIIRTENPRSRVEFLTEARKASRHGIAELLDTGIRAPSHLPQENSQVAKQYVNLSYASLFLTIVSNFHQREGDTTAEAKRSARQESQAHIRRT